MIITLLGMSGVGKSYWSRQLQNLGWQRICCDDLIGEQLGIKAISNVADWMGQPYTVGYQQRQQQYVDIERQVMTKIVQRLTKRDPGPLVIDTTGSVIYSGQDVCEKLQQYSTTLYIESTAYMRQQMVERYIADSKPVVWEQQFKQAPDQTDLAAIVECYPKLLQFRATRYQQYANVILPYDHTSQLSFTVNDLLNAILQH